MHAFQSKEVIGIAVSSDFETRLRGEEKDWVKYGVLVLGDVPRWWYTLVLKCYSGASKVDGIALVSIIFINFVRLDTHRQLIFKSE